MKKILLSLNIALSLFSITFTSFIPAAQRAEDKYRTAIVNFKSKPAYESFVKNLNAENKQLMKIADHEDTLNGHLATVVFNGKFTKNQIQSLLDDLAFNFKITRFYQMEF